MPIWGPVWEYQRNLLTAVKVTRVVTKVCIFVQFVLKALNVFLQLWDKLLNGDFSASPSYFTNATGSHYYYNFMQFEVPGLPCFFPFCAYLLDSTCSRIVTLVFV